jgi:hypothetical protein
MHILQVEWIHLCVSTIDLDRVFGTLYTVPVALTGAEQPEFPAAVIL